MLKQLMDEVRATRLEVKKMRKEQKITQVALIKIQDTTSLAKQLQEMQEKTFAIPGSEFQVIINICLYTTNSTLTTTHHSYLCSKV